MTRWEVTKYVNECPTLLERIYAYLFVMPADILLPGNEWINNGKSIYQRPIASKKQAKLMLLKFKKEDK